MKKLELRYIQTETYSCVNVESILHYYLSHSLGYLEVLTFFFLITEHICKATLLRKTQEVTNCRLYLFCKECYQHQHVQQAWEFPSKILNAKKCTEWTRVNSASHSWNPLHLKMPIIYTCTQMYTHIYIWPPLHPDFLMTKRSANISPK